MQEDATPRRGLVLGAGGVLGAAWTIGALRALEEVTGFDPRTAQTVVGTSAGSVLSAFVGRGVSTEQMADNQRGAVTEGQPSVDYDYDSQSALPPRPKMFTLGSARLLAATARNPRRVTPLTAFAALMPAGRGSIGSVGRLIESVTAESLEFGIEGASDPWPRSPQTWIVAMDYDTGRRVVFGRDGAPTAELPEAIMASCAIPGWYAPITINGRRYVDGGVCSATSLDLLANCDLDEVFVLAPMASFAPDNPRSRVARIERRVRRSITKRLLHESERVRASGTRITMLAPGAEDLRAIGVNLMDSRRRSRVFETSLRTSAAALGRSSRRVSA